MFWKNLQIKEGYLRVFWGEDFLIYELFAYCQSKTPIFTLLRQSGASDVNSYDNNVGLLVECWSGVNPQPTFGIDILWDFQTENRTQKCVLKSRSRNIWVPNDSVSFSNTILGSNLYIFFNGIKTSDAIALGNSGNVWFHCRIFYTFVENFDRQMEKQTDRPIKLGTESLNSTKLEIGLWWSWGWAWQ